MKIQDIYREEFVKKIQDINPGFFLFEKDVENWEIIDWEIWANIVKVFHKLIYNLH